MYRVKMFGTLGNNQVTTYQSFIETTQKMNFIRSGCSTSLNFAAIGLDNEVLTEYGFFPSARKIQKWNVVVYAGNLRRLRPDARTDFV
jgi:hypothetical protein